MIKQIRADMNLTQEQLAVRLFIDARQVRRLENGGADMEIWQFMSMLEMLGCPAEDFWLLYLDSKEFDGYRAFRHVKRLLSERKFDEVKSELPKLEKGKLSEQPFIKQFVARAKIKIDETITDDEAIKKLYKIIKMSNPNFEESKISEYRLTYNEVNIIIDLAGRLSKIDERDRAIDLQMAVIDSRKKSRTTEEDRAALFPVIMSNLSSSLGLAGRYKESLKICNEAIEICREYNNLRFVPKILHNMASCYKELGEERKIYEPILIRGYHCAYAIGDTKTARLIKKDAEIDFGITAHQKRSHYRFR